MHSRAEVYTTDTGAKLRVVKTVGEGNFGVVQLVKNAANTEACVKSVRVKKGGSNLQEMLREVTTMQTLRHDNIVDYYEHWYRNNTLHIMMEYCPFGTLEDIIDKTRAAGLRVQEIQVISYLKQLGSALEFCHARNVIHRDLKPANVLVSCTHNLKIADFGLAKELQNNAELCATLCGTPLYMAPQVWGGAGYTVSADMWALGCIAFELMALKPAWGTNVRTQDELKQRVHAGKLDTSALEKMLPAARNAKPERMYQEFLVHMVKKLLDVNTMHRLTASCVCSMLTTAKSMANANLTAFAQASLVEDACAFVQRVDNEEALRNAAMAIQTSIRRSLDRRQKHATLFDKSAKHIQLAFRGSWMGRQVADVPTAHTGFNVAGDGKGSREGRKDGSSDGKRQERLERLARPRWVPAVHHHHKVAPTSVRPQPRASRVTPTARVAPTCKTPVQDRASPGAARVAPTKPAMRAVNGMVRGPATPAVRQVTTPRPGVSPTGANATGAASRVFATPRAGGYASPRDATRARVHDVLTWAR